MKLSDLYAQTEGARAVLFYDVLLAAPDGDGEDVDLSAIGRVEIDAKAGEVRLYPTQGDREPDDTTPGPSLDDFLSELPEDVGSGNDYRLMVELPLVREDSGHDAVNLVEICELHIGRDSREVWFLARPAAEFASGLLSS